MQKPCNNCHLYYPSNPSNPTRRCSGLIDKHSKKPIAHHSQLHDHIVEQGYYDGYDNPKQPGECPSHQPQTPEELKAELEWQKAYNYKNLDLCHTCKNYEKNCNGELYANAELKVPPTKIPVDLEEQDNLIGYSYKNSWIPQNSCPYYQQDMSKQPEKQVWQLNYTPWKEPTEPLTNKLIKDPNFPDHNCLEEIEITDLCDNCVHYRWDNSINPERNCIGKYDLATDKTVRLGQRDVIPFKTPNHYHTPQTDEICPDYKGQSWNDRYKEERDPLQCNPIILQNKDIYRKVYKNLYPNSGGTPVYLYRRDLPTLKWFIAKLKTNPACKIEEKSYVQPANQRNSTPRVHFNGYTNNEVLELANMLKELLQTFKDDTELILLD